MLRNILRCVIALFVIAPVAAAQNGTIAGRVTAIEGGAPIPGAQVSVSGVGNTITRDDGRYSIAVRAGTYKVRAGRIGYARDSVVNVVVSANAVTTINFLGGLDQP